MRRIVIVGTFPPPVHGMSVANESIHRKLGFHQNNTTIINTSTNALSRSMFSRLSRLRVISNALLRVSRLKPERDLLYIALNGGLGQLFDICFITIARINGIPCFAHHHSYAYLMRKKIITTLLLRAAGPETTHIVLCDDMKKRLQKHYQASRILVLSNLAYYRGEGGNIHREKIRSVGFISNITREKGGYTIIRLSHAICEQQLPIKVIVAGPCFDRELCDELNHAQSEGLLTWIGPVYGDAKKEFWKNVDAFAFPTEYQNEAEPLVVWEAMSAGVPILSFKRGCIDSQIGSGGEVFPGEDDFVNRSIETLTRWLKDPSDYQAYSKNALDQYQDAITIAESRWQELLQLIS